MKLQPELSLSALHDLFESRFKQVYSPYVDSILSLELKASLKSSLENGGKRIRPILVYATGAIFNAPLENLDIAASAIELIHTYSLIHDDLPAMDDADLRRGKPACHKVFGEGMAILAGDALQALAMQILASHPGSITADKRVQMLGILSKASGTDGMVGGQALDINLLDTELPEDLLRDIYHLKTGRLITACMQLGQLASGDDDEFNQTALYQFGECLGFAFQIQDDILDIETSTQDLGKPQGIDVKNNKRTYPSLHGLIAAKQKVDSLYLEALETINYLGNEAQLLREVADKMLNRKN